MSINNIKKGHWEGCGSEGFIVVNGTKTWLYAK